VCVYNVFGVYVITIFTAVFAFINQLTVFTILSPRPAVVVAVDDLHLARVRVNNNIGGGVVVAAAAAFIIIIVAVVN